MSGRSKLSLAIALALIGGNAFALGLGSIQVRSGLNQPLDAEIAVTTESAAEAAGLNVSLASAEDFERVGLSRARVTVPIDFSVSTNSRGQPVIKLTTKDIVREPFLDFLVEVNWPKGKLLREYTVLLDPPVTAPAARGAPASVAPAKESVAAPPQKLTEAPKEPKAKPSTVKPPKSERGEKQPPVAKAPAPTPSSAKAPAGGDYGPVAQGETLSEVARATRPDESSNVNQMMLALLKANPNAFYKDNINALKRGAILRIPSNDELKATGNAAAAAAAVHEQNDAWSNGAGASKPTIVASTGSPSTPATKPSTTAKPDKSPGGEHLALVPPRAGKDSQATADRPGPASGSGGGSASDKAELARTKEALVSREQEATELKSRVKQLEDINNKDQRLLTLKENAIAELQAKLKELQAGKTGAGTATPTPPATATTTTKPADTTAATTKPGATKPADATKPAETGKPETKLTAEDIWGNIANSEKATGKPGTPSATPTPGATPAPSATPSTGTTPSATPAPSTAGATSATPSTTASTPAPTPTPTPSSTTTSTGTTVTPVTSPSTTPPTSLAPTPTPAPKPPAPAPKATPAPAPAPETPFYQNTMVQIGAGVLLLLLGAFALLRFMRKPKAVLTPIAPGDGGMAPFGGEEEHHLLDALAQSPGDPHLSLELLRLYYAQRDAGKFEAAAEAMYAHIADPTQPEWQEVRAMGADLCPHNPLFASDMVGGDHHDQAHTVFGHYDPSEQVPQEEHFDLGGHHDTKLPAEENFDFDLTDHSAAPAVPVEDLSFDAEPLHDTHVPHAPAPAPMAFTPAPVPAPAPAPAKAADDFFAGEDAIGTKLDLAKAYLDMGDPEGARSMLDEVMAEGNDSQKGEARKLLAEIR